MGETFDRTSAIGVKGVRLVAKFLLDTYDGELEHIHDPHDQKHVGDLRFKSSYGRTFTIEVKTEVSNVHKNLFLETFSNKSLLRPGWITNLDCDLLFYCFLNEMALYRMSFRSLKRWVYHPDGKETAAFRAFPEKRQNRHEQANDTWGRTVPILFLADKIERFQRFNLD